MSVFFLCGVLQLEADIGRTRKRKSLLECLLATIKIVSASIGVHFIFFFDQKVSFLEMTVKTIGRFHGLMKWAESAVSIALSGMSWNF